MLEARPWACQACVTQEYFSRFQAVNTFFKMQVCHFCFPMASGLTVSLSLDPSPAARCFLLFPGFLAGIQLNLPCNSVRIPVPCFPVRQPWQPFMGCIAPAVLQPYPGAPLCLWVIPASFTSQCPVPCTSSHGLLLPWDLPYSCRLELSWRSSEGGGLASHLPPSWALSPSCLPPSPPLGLTLTVRFWEDGEILGFH